jgi:acyl-CoA thioesterase FadM
VRTTMTVTAEDCFHDADQVDPTAPGYGAHLPFHAILQRCGLAWRGHLAAMDDGRGMAALDTGVIVPNVNADFLAEVHVGTLHIDVTLTAVGRTSFTLRCDVVQDDAVAARVTVVLVSFDYAERRAVPLTSGQRAVLESAQVPQ